MTKQELPLNSLFEGTTDNDTAVAANMDSFALEMAAGAARVAEAERKRHQLEHTRAAIGTIMEDAITLSNTISKERVGLVTANDVTYNGQPASVYIPAYETRAAGIYGSSAQARVQILNPNNQIVADVFIVGPSRKNLVPTVQMVDYEYNDDSSNHSRYEMRRDPQGSVLLTAETAATIVPELPAIAATLEEACSKQPVTA